MQQPNFGTVERPLHVPADRVIDFDYFHPAGIEDADVFDALKLLHDAPDISWTPRNGGHWIASRSADVRWMREDWETFSHEEMLIPRGSMNILLPPVNVDPPRHARYRAVLNPSFTPTKVRALRSKARAVAVDLIEELAPRGHCEFINDFARVMPVVVFLSIMDLGTGRRAEFVKWAGDYTTATDQGVKDRAAAQIAAFLSEVLDERERNPGEDLLSRIAAWRSNPRFEDESEVLGMAMVVFIGGLDTVANMLGFVVRHLAENPEARRRLLASPGLIPNAAEEYIRRHGLTLSARLLKRDVTHKGVTMKRDELVLVIDALAGIDERAYPDPMTIDYDRDVRIHDTFGNGAHKCVGEHLARMEVAVFLEEWLKRIPDFRLDPAIPSRSYAGTVVGQSQLGLRWD